MAIPNSLPPPTFDIDTWTNNYEGALVPFRFAHVALRCPSLAHQSLSLALTAAHNGRDIGLYRKLCELAGNLGLSDLSTPDGQWMTRQEEENKRELARLEGELRGYKNNLIRESIRMGQEDLATHHLSTGGPVVDPAHSIPAASTGYHAAYGAYSKMREYCTTPAHIASLTLNLIYTSFIQAVSAQQLGFAPNSHFSTANLLCGRVRNAGVKEEEQRRLTPIALASSGIAYLGLGQYQDAANSFVKVPFEYHTLGQVQGTDFSKTVASGNDVAIYGGLCALATFTRQQLIDEVLGGDFRQFLELEPHMRKAISLYTTAKYQACLAILRHYYSDWSLDIFLGALNVGSGQPHLDRLLSRVREKSITAYFSSFAEVSLASLASTFPPTSSHPTAMEDEVLSMIESGMLEARLDVVNGILIAPSKKSRATTHAEAKNAAEEIERTLLLRLHKVNTILAGCEIVRAKNSGWETGTAGNGF
ncbi:Hypothetical protein R9X50_00422600 [Acrodontium crateriforme]|uniref:PCI domain-containing protein n=1 Tax=Acrodontium crateriforme TaxID=150365 RepID=A0AAQ3RA13_9PEZI|nr:Hypothetical protein R9X50_00422600 [Acrodontium crateriforme]